jgi:hypothetical protein
LDLLTPYVPLRTTRNYSAIADLHTLHFTVIRKLWFSVFISRILATDFNTVINISLIELHTPNTTRKIFSSQADFQISTELVAISSQSFSTAVSRDSLNYHSAGLGSLLYCLGSDPTENIDSIVIVQQYLDYCFFVRCRGNVFTESLHINNILLRLRYSGFQASCHFIIFIFNNVI